ncbi:hypothetical protein ACI78V_09960 [Geodermatophilus sp. SYSU D00742]
MGSASAAARLLRRSPAEPVDRNIWIALPELGGRMFHSFLLPTTTSSTTTMRTGTGCASWPR